MATSKKSRSRAPKIIISLVVFLALLATASEFACRYFIKQELRSEFSSVQSQHDGSNSQEPTISFSNSPLLLGFLTGDVKEVKIELPKTLEVSYPDRSEANPVVKGTPEAKIVVKGLHRGDNDRFIARSMTVETSMPDEYILNSIKKDMAEKKKNDDSATPDKLVQDLVTITSLKSDAAKQTINVELTGGAAKVSLRPKTTADGTVFEIVQSQLFGLNMPQELSKELSESLNNALKDSVNGLKITDLKIKEGGVNVTLSGSEIDLQGFKK